jgi:hypothetical protein
MEKLANKKPPIEDRGKFLRDIALGFEKGQIFLIALKLDVFTQLKEPKTAESLSKDLETHPEITRRFLDVLVALKLLSKREVPAHKHEHKYDRESIDWIARGTMLGRLQATLKIVSKLPEFLNAKRLIDLGGGHGLFGIGFAQENPQLEVVVFDQPGVTLHKNTSTNMECKIVLKP